MFVSSCDGVVNLTCEINTVKNVTASDTYKIIFAFDEGNSKYLNLRASFLQNKGFLPQEGEKVQTSKLFVTQCVKRERFVGWS